MTELSINFLLTEDFLQHRKLKLSYELNPTTGIITTAACSGHYIKNY